MAKPVSVTTLPAKKGRKARPLLPSGHPVRFRLIQKLGWTGVAALLGVGFIAGLYWYVLQQDWHNILPFLPKGTSAKTWWDDGMGFITSPNWRNGVWRHGVRDKAEPEAWAIVGGILLGSSYKSRRVIKLPYLALGALVMFALVVLGALFITWFTNFGPGKHMPNQYQLQDILLGLIVGHVLHYLWMPMANSIRYQVVSLSLHRTAAVPLWVSLPIAPPGWREMWAQLKADGVTPATLEKEDKHKQSRYLVPLAVLVFLVIAVTGCLAKYAFAHGAHIPVLNP